MGDFVAVLICAIIAFGIYKLFELFVRRKERMAIIERMMDNGGGSPLNGSLNVDLRMNSSNLFTSLRFGLLLLGVGLGLFIVGLLHLNYIPELNGDERWIYKEAFAFLYFASPITFGGVGLLVAYMVEKGNRSKDRSAD